MAQQQVPAPIQHNGYRIWVEPDGDHFRACTERIDRKPIFAGYSIGQRVLTFAYEVPEHAMEAAKAEIDAGRVQ